jgi:hypothetical protein
MFGGSGRPAVLVEFVCGCQWCFQANVGVVFPCWNVTVSAVSLDKSEIDERCHHCAFVVSLALARWETLPVPYIVC